MNYYRQSFDDYEDFDHNSMYVDDYDATPESVSIEELLADPLVYFYSLWEDCGSPVVQQYISKSASLILSSLVLALLRFTSLSPWILHCLSFSLGVGLLHQFFPEDWRLVGLIIFYSSIVFFLASRFPSRVARGFTVVALLGAVAICEFAMVADAWHRLRGPALLMTMKVISLVLDEERPNFTQFLGYLLCPGTVIFGPWIHYSFYSDLVESHKKFSLSWIFRIAFHLLASFFFLLCSVCIFSVFLTYFADPFGLPDYVARWCAAYRDAFSFRSSHYFVCFTSQATLLALGAGLDSVTPDDDGNENEALEDDRANKRSDEMCKPVAAEVTNPIKVEIPRSLVEVVIFWNIPMHRWLKDYVFLPSRPLMGTGMAILATYAVSSLLHGLNFQLAAVLFSLGFYSYTEHVLRAKLARIFSSCVMARPCRTSCLHTHKGDSISVRIVNLLFGAVAVFHLAYLGVAFDNSDEQAQGYSMNHVLSKWSQLGYASPILALVTFGFYIII